MLGAKALGFVAYRLWGCSVSVQVQYSEPSGGLGFREFREFRV